jgi:hypothetical protein
MSAQTPSRRDFFRLLLAAAGAGAAAAAGISPAAGSQIERDPTRAGFLIDGEFIGDVDLLGLTAQDLARHVRIEAIRARAQGAVADMQVTVDIRGLRESIANMNQALSEAAAKAMDRAMQEYAQGLMDYARSMRPITYDLTGWNQAMSQGDIVEFHITESAGGSRRIDIGMTGVTE